MSSLKYWHDFVFKELAPEDGVIFSPKVEVFREGTADGYPFLENPCKLGCVISIAMPNANDRIRDAPVDMPPKEEYLSVIDKKLRTLVGTCVQAGITHLVMTDVGCGAYGNNPKEVGKAFGAIIKEHFPQAFSEILLVSGRTFADAAEAAAAVEKEPDPDEPAPSPGAGSMDEEFRDRLYACFQGFDENGDGLVDREELSQAMQKLDEDYWGGELGEQRIDSLMSEIDVDGDGTFRYETFCDWVARGSASAKDEASKEFMSFVNPE